MKIFKKITLTLLAILTFFVIANAAAIPSNSIDKDGAYVQFDGGTNFLQNQIDNDLTFRAGWNANGGLGYKYNNWRLSATGGYLNNRMDGFQSSSSINNALGVEADLSEGKSTAQAYMLNGYYDFKWSSMPRISPYIGFGAGAISVKTDFNLRDQTTIVINDDTTITFPAVRATQDTAFGYQGILGLTYYVLSHFSIFFEYRHLESAQITLYKEDVVVTSKTVGTNTVRLHQKGRYRNNLLNVGIRLTF